MKSLSNVIIESSRLKLVPLSKKHAEDIFKEFTDEVTLYMFPKTPNKIEETLAYIESQQPKIENGEDLPVIILNKETGEFLGGGGAHNLKTETPEFGIWIKKSAQGNKYGREAVVALKEWIDQNMNYKYLVYPVDKENIPSRKIAESLGGVVMDEYKKPNMAGRILDEVEYRIYPKN